jgi:Ca2+-binding EF-hand superfamily protein
MESMKLQGEIKGQDRMMRTVRHPRDIATPQSEQGGGRHPLNYDNAQYYPGRDLIDAVSDLPGNDYQVRPAHLPDFYNPPPEGADSVGRMQRIREVIRQRYAGRPGLVGVFRNCSLTKSGYIFAKDMMQVLDQMGIKVSDTECKMLVKAVDKDQKGAVTFEEFADLVYGSKVNVGGSAHEPQERHVRHVTKTLVDDLIHNGQQLGKAFCEIDPERNYEISKAQFANALGTACNHISKQAVDFLWSAQFPGNQGHEDLSVRVIDWRSFMSQMAHFAHDQRPPTPCCVQGRKRQYDLLQRTAAITGGSLADVDLNRPEQNVDDDVTIIADKLVHRHTDLLHHPRQAAFLAEPFVEEIRVKAERTSRALPKRLPEKRLRKLLANRETVHQDELVDLICQELERPEAQQPLAKSTPLYSRGGVDVMTLDPASFQAQKLAAEAGGYSPHGNDAVLTDAPAPFSGAACLQLVRADVEAYIASQRTNRDHEVDVKQLFANVYRPPDERKVLHTVNDGLNRQIRGNRPPRERAPHEEEARYDNYWQARYMMELINDAIAEVENSNGGKLKSSKIFKRLDIDNDGYISLSDLRSACEKYKIPNTSADLHAAFTALDKGDHGSVNIGEFSRNYEVHQGSLLDGMQKPIRSVFHEGGVENGGPVQDALDAKERKVMEEAGTVEGKEYLGQGGQPGSPARSSNYGRSGSAPPGSVAGSARAGSVRANSVAGSGVSKLSSTGSSMIYESQVARMTGKGRVSDVIRARCNTWKPQKAELYTSMAPTRYGMTIYPDTRHVTEANIPLSHSYLGEGERFKTTSNMKSIFSVPDHSDPQTEDAMRRHARGEYRVERIRQRNRDFTERCEVANEAARQFDELKVARKALNQLNYERRCHMSCC